MDGMSEERRKAAGSLLICWGRRSMQDEKKSFQEREYDEKGRRCWGGRGDEEGRDGEGRNLLLSSFFMAGFLTFLRSSTS